ncbi:hypothetical protein MRX96_007548 [Rhipicephalus microplus]
MRGIARVSHLLVRLSFSCPCRTDKAAAAAAAASIPFHPPRTRPTMGAIHHGRPFQRRQTAKGPRFSPQEKDGPDDRAANAATHPHFFSRHRMPVHLSL